MMCSDAISRIQRKCGYRSDKATEILDEINDAQQSMELGVPYSGGVFIPWFLATEVQSVLTVVGEERLLLPSDFSAELQDSKLYYFNPDADDEADEWVQLKKDDEAFLRQAYPGTGVPKGYFNSGGYWRVLPVPDAEYRLKVLVSGKDTVLTSTPDISNRWLTNAPWVLIAAAGVNFATSIRDPGAVQYFQNRLLIETKLLFTQTVFRLDANDRPIMGGEN